MDMSHDRTEPKDALTNWLASSGSVAGDRLPPERALAVELGVSRGELRKALMALEVDGIIERHVGRGTFLKSPADLEGASEPIIQRLCEVSSPHAAMMARLSLEPELAGHAAIHAAPRHLAELRRLCERMRAASSWQEYEHHDSRFHELIAIASGNAVLVELHRIVNAVRLSVVWSRLNLPEDGPPREYHSFAEHDEILAGLERRDRISAYQAMKQHLKSVRATLLKDG